MDTRRAHESNPRTPMPMKRYSAFISVLLSLAASTAAQDLQHLRQVQTIPLPGVKGRIDHLAVDLEGHRIFLSGLGNNSVEVLDTEAGKDIQSLTGFRKPQGQLYVDDLKKLYVANGDDGSCRIYDGKSLTPLQTIMVSPAADAMAYDPAEKLMYLGSDGADPKKPNGDLAIIDVTKDKIVTVISTDAHASGGVVESSGNRVFDLVADKSQIVVIDRKSHAILDKWVVPGVAKLPAIALDEANHRLFVASRTPPTFLVVDTDSGKVVASLPTVGIVDGMWYDADSKRVYVTGGEGFLYVYQQTDPDHYAVAEKIPTGPIARTGLFVPEWKRLYVAVPQDKDKDAEVRVFDTQP